MNASSQSFPASAADAEVTAELPVLDVAAYEARQGQDPLANTDTWTSPTQNTAILAQLSQPDADTGYESARSAAIPASVAAKLEGELRSLASNLQELETRLAAKGERLAILEKELAESRSAGQSAAERAAALSDELTGNRAAIAAATTQIEGLRETIREREEAKRLAEERATELQTSLQRQEAHFADNAAAANARAAELTASHERALQASWQQVAQLQTQSAAHLESLQSMEGRRGVFDSLLRGLDIQVADREQVQSKLSDELARSTTHGLELTRELDRRTQRIAQLETEVAALNSNLGTRSDEAGALGRTNAELNQSLQAQRQESAAQAARIAELEAQIVAADQTHATAVRTAAAAHSDLEAANTALTAQKATLDGELAALRAQSVEHATALQQLTADHAARQEQIEAQSAQIAALTEQVAQQAQTLVAATERNRANQERIEVAENDVRVSEEAINRLESEVRTRSMRIEELTRINSQMQSDIADARRWLGERDSLMQRLETEAAHSAALVDNIQRSVRALAPGSGTTGNHELVRETGTRLLVRSQDGREVVHVLGRRTTIGRTPDNDLQIDVGFVSRHHAVLLTSGQQTILEDLNSTNGVHVNGTRVTRQALNDGDLVMIGKARFRFAIRSSVNRNNAELSA